MPMSEKKSIREKSIREKSIRELTKAALCTAAVALGIALYVVEVSSCANTKGSPTGGPKDTIPPVVLSVIPELNTTSFPREKQDIRIFFNEFVQLKDANKNILLSPPLSKKIKTKIKGKSIVVEFPLPLDSARTYTIYFGSAIADNNEGNPLLGYTYAFSTGSAIDSMLVSGRVVENETLKSVKDIAVAAYLVETDSCVINTLPDAITKTDEYGYFCLQNLKPQKYALFAFSDENGNCKYDQGVEKIAFMDTMITPQVVMRPGLPQTTIYLPKDTTELLSRPIEYQLYLFKERAAKQYITNKGRPTRRGAFVKFNSTETELLSLKVEEVEPKRIMKQFNPDRDSLTFWIVGGSVPKDTINVEVEYMKPDSLGNMAPFTEKLKLVAPRDKSKNRNGGNSTEEQNLNNLNSNYLSGIDDRMNNRLTQEERRRREEEKKREEAEKREKSIRPDLLKMTFEAKPEKIEETGYIFTFPEPLAKANFDTLQMVFYNQRKQKGEMKLLHRQDSTNFLCYYVWPEEPFKVGYEYNLYVPTAAFRDINNFTNDSLTNQIFLPTDDNLSTITVDVKGADTRYIIELVNDKCTVVYGKFTLDRDGKHTFKYLKEGDYAIRITQDRNRNGKLDSGTLIPRRQPEAVRFFKLPDGKETIKLLERTDIEQTINLPTLF